ncbi:MAG TPA: hypothetical protein VKU44_00780 [Terriglobia bacterium]|nr:hypothetical protein [Terriglobia bacterium]
MSFRDQLLAVQQQLPNAELVFRVPLASLRRRDPSQHAVVLGDWVAQIGSVEAQALTAEGALGTLLEKLR